MEEDVAAARLTAEALGPDVRLAVDANRSWSTGEAVRFSTACAELPLVIEQPCDDVNAIAALRPMLRHPLFLDESAVDLRSVARAAAQGVCDGFGHKITRLGGISAMRAARDLCAAFQLPHTVDDSFGGDVIAAACAQMAMTVSPRRLEGVWIAEPHIAARDAIVGAVTIKDGRITPPAGPGLGVAPAREALGAPLASYGRQGRRRKGGECRA